MRLVVPYPPGGGTDTVARPLAQIGVDPAPGTPDELQRLIRDETQLWTKVAKAAGVKAD
jgi:tripartite-type tricarboxylate transporter receptor subunit TctC